MVNLSKTSSCDVVRWMGVLRNAIQPKLMQIKEAIAPETVAEAKGEFLERRDDLTTKMKFSRPDNNLPFWSTLRKRVNDYFEDNNLSKTGNSQLYIKTAIMLSLYIIPLILINAQIVSGWGIVGMFMLMGVGASGIGLCIMHDANHGSFSAKKWVNNLMSYSMNLIGGSSFTWKIQHNVLHHSYTNIYDFDEDIHDKPFLRLSPHGKPHGYQRLQHIYFPLLYCLATLSWVLLKDFRQLKTYNKGGLTERGGHDPVKETWTMIFSKSLYIFAVIALPIILGSPVWAVLTGFVFMHMIAGLYITMVFQLAHVVEGPEHHAPSDSGRMDSTWAIHQIKTTANFASRSKLVTWMTGGLNHQIEHHLFPRISHVHYQKISRIVRETAAEFNLPYYEHKKVGEAVASHIRVLKEFGRPSAA